jgi:hypothetical protein
LDLYALSATSAANKLEYERLKTESEAEERQASDEQKARERTESEEAIVGAAFLIVGFVLWGRNTQQPPVTPV